MNSGIKLLAFKMINVSAMYAALQFAYSKNRCTFDDSGGIFLTLILTDLIVKTLIIHFAAGKYSRVWNRYHPTDLVSKVRSLCRKRQWRRQQTWIWCCLWIPRSFLQTIYLLSRHDSVSFDAFALFDCEPHWILFRQSENGEDVPKAQTIGFIYEGLFDGLVGGDGCGWSGFLPVTHFKF